MITKIIHQIWNERKQNAWLFLELIVAIIFLWLAIDPLFTLVCRGNLPKGYTPEKVYRVKYEAFVTDPSSYQASENNKAEFLAQLTNALNSLPEIECCFMSQAGLEPNPAGYSSTMVAVTDDKPDSLIDWKNARVYNIVANEKSRFFETVRAIDVKTGKVLQQADYAGKDGAYLSRRQAMALFGTTDVVGKKFINVHHDSFTILGVFEDLQMISYDEYTPIVLYCNNNVDKHTFRDEIYFRLKDSADEDEFKKKFENEFMPKYSHGIYHIMGLESYMDCIEEYDKQYNITNKYRLYTGLSGFALFCAFMGVFSAFWIRTNSRRRDIGIMRSMGATASSAVRQFVTEAMILVTVAFVVSMPLIAHYIYVEGFAEPLAKVPTWVHNETPDQSYLHNRALPHFAIVTAIAYLLISAIAIAGSLLPAVRITRSLPADALRE
ncbi:MAG: FtsX-like permease family protein [Bacteroidaceae bacterium]|nr:FtsX-like permease family protein [Bacteroidaceae bacterium]